jgi:hypothetical protein
MTKGKAPESIHYIFSHFNVGVNEFLFNTSFSSWRDTWLLEKGETCHMTFHRDLFEYLNDNVDGIVYFSYTSSLKPLRISIVRHKFLGFPYFNLHYVPYLPEL